MDRRTFLKLAGIGSLSVATGCGGESEKNLYTLIHAPDDMVTGQATWYASTCRECPAGCGIIARNREGRVVKVEGNPLHPINRGKLCMRGQAAVQAIYHPDRLQKPLLREGTSWQAISFERAEALLSEKISAAVGRPGALRMVSAVSGETGSAIAGEMLAAYQSPPPLVFETFGYESLKRANALVFGMDGLPSYAVEKADVLVGFGADFLETWLSPVEYARKFKQMHALHGTVKGRFYQISPLMTLTGANADSWLSVRPEAEFAVALYLVHAALKAGRGDRIPVEIRRAIEAVSAPYDLAAIAPLARIDEKRLENVTRRLLAARAPLVLGQGAAGSAMGGLRTNIAVNLLNLVLDPDLQRIDFARRHRVETAAPRRALHDLFDDLSDSRISVCLFSHTNPVFATGSALDWEKRLRRSGRFVVSFNPFMDETAALADLIFPVRMPLERWGEYAGKSGITATLQPAMGPLTPAPDLMDLMIRLTPGAEGKWKTHQDAVYKRIHLNGIASRQEWLHTLRHGGRFSEAGETGAAFVWKFSFSAVDPFADALQDLQAARAADTLLVVPSIRLFDGRGANRPWLNEIPDPLTKVAWQTTVLLHPAAADRHGVKPGGLLTLKARDAAITAPAYPFDGMDAGVMAVAVGQGHEQYGRYASRRGVSPLGLLSAAAEPLSGGTDFMAGDVTVTASDKRVDLAHTDGSKTQHGRSIALTVPLHELAHGKPHSRHEAGLSMHDFPLALPLPEGYDPHRDLYPPHPHQDDYRWAMVVDLDRCIGCGACMAACYAENNLGVVGEERIIEGREMSWIRIERYHDPRAMEKVIFFPLMCQHCDNAPCEMVCPVYAPHHGKEGLNNQIYNRCIGTRYCSQNCPYKARRFNWFEWDRPHPLPLQLNPDVTVRMRGVMEKCSFCVQRIKNAHDTAKNEKRRIRDGEILPACAQTCPTDAILFGNMADPESRVRKLTADPRAYQALGYLNTKSAVIYLKKVVQEI